MDEPRSRTTCSRHGLVYDPTASSGCVICRREEQPPSPATHPWRLAAVLAAVALAIAGVCALGAYVQMRRVRAREAAQEAAKKDEAERVTRQTAVAILPPAPPPAALALVGDEGRDADGYPTKCVDPVALRRALGNRRYADLSAYFERLQAAFEDDPFAEYWPEDAASAFRSAEPELRRDLDEWASATPDSFAPYLARGVYWSAVAAAARGDERASDTSHASFAEMREAAARAVADLDHALAIHPRLVAAHSAKIHIQITVSDDAGEARSLASALALCPTCFIPRSEHMRALQPRWGGSYDAMAAFARSAPIAQNRRLRLLAGYADLDRAEMLHIDRKLDEAAWAIQRALAVGECSAFLVERASIESAQGDTDLALKDFDRAARRRPFDAEILARRAHANVASKRWEAAGRDLLAALRMNPTERRARSVFDSVVQGLEYEGWQDFSAGRRDDALRVLDLALDLAPTKEDLRKRREWVATSPVDAQAPPASTDDLGAAEKAANDAPDDFATHRRLDDVLARRGDYAGVVDMWNAYLGRHPDEGLAYLERGGALLHLQRMKEAYADASRACGLGVAAGCAYAKRVEPMAR